MKGGELMLEPHYNAALWAYKTQEYENAEKFVKIVLKIYPSH